MNNARQRRNNVVIFNIESYNVGKRRNNIVKMTASKKTKTTLVQIEYLELKVLTTISQSSLAPHVKRSMSKSTCKTAKVLKRL